MEGFQMHLSLSSPYNQHSLDGTHSMAAPCTGGYSLLIHDTPLDKKYLCGKCHLTLKEPMQSFCGHRFCKSCTEELLQDNSEVTCPACVEEGADGEFSLIKSGQIFPDNAMKREFLKWTVKCEFEGCQWRGPFAQYDTHRNSCEFRAEVCICGQLIYASQKQRHMETECPERIVTCDYCQTQVRFLQCEIHARVCLKRPVECDVCGKQLLREKLANHYNGECSVRKIACPYECGEFIQPEHMSMHEAQEGSVVAHIRSLHVRLQNVAGGPTASAGPNQALPVEVTRDIQSLQFKIGELEQRVSMQGGSRAPSSSSNSSDGGNFAVLERKLMVLEEKINAFENVAGVLENGVERGTAHIEMVERNGQGERKNLEQRIKTLERSLQIKDVTTAELEQRINTLEVASYDGVLLWKITDFAKKRQEAISGRTTSIYSPPFYTSRTGYKMSARLYPNGDGMGKGSYLSLFFVVMRNHYDNLLRWPFRQKVTMILIDQNNKDHIIDAFRPDPSSSSFRKPMSEMNIASGCPLFCAVSNLENNNANGYVKDDTMYIKIIVDSSDLPTN